MEIFEWIFQVLMRLPFWAVFASPLLAMAFYSAKKLSYLNWPRKKKLFIFIAISSVLLAPMPMGMFMVLLPNGYVMFSGIEYYTKVWPWFIVSLPLSTIVIYVVFSKRLNGT